MWRCTNAMYILSLLRHPRLVSSDVIFRRSHGAWMTSSLRACDVISSRMPVLIGIQFYVNNCHFNVTWFTGRRTDETSLPWRHASNVTSRFWSDVTHLMWHHVSNVTSRSERIMLFFWSDLGARFILPEITGAPKNKYFIWVLSGIGLKTIGF